MYDRPHNPAAVVCVLHACVLVCLTAPLSRLTVVHRAQGATLSLGFRASGVNNEGTVRSLSHLRHGYASPPPSRRSLLTTACLSASYERATASPRGPCEASASASGCALTARGSTFASPSKPQPPAPSTSTCGPEGKV
eukprot:scaffold2935_cov104-Isochrysis_galbana.AAC.6